MYIIFQVVIALMLGFLCISIPVIGILSFIFTLDYKEAFSFVSDIIEDTDKTKSKIYSVLKILYFGIIETFFDLFALFYLFISAILNCKSKKEKFSKCLLEAFDVFESGGKTYILGIPFNVKIKKLEN